MLFLARIRFGFHYWDDFFFETILIFFIVLGPRTDADVTIDGRFNAEIEELMREDYVLRFMINYFKMVIVMIDLLVICFARQSSGETTKD